MGAEREGEAVILAFDPGPSACGVVLYDADNRRVLEAHKAMPVGGACGRAHYHSSEPLLVAIERVQSYGISGASLLRTSEVVGRLWQSAIVADVPVQLVYRREVLRALDVTGKGNRDSLVRQRLIEMHGGERRAAVGTKKAPGPLYGVSGHAWAALAVAVAASRGAGEVVRQS